MGTRIPMKHQIAAVEYALSVQNPAFLMQMRLGKTYAAILWAQALYAFRGRFVVVAPLSVLSAWEKELSTESETYIRAYGISTSERAEVLKVAFNSTLKGNLWVLTNYETLALYPDFTKWAWDIVILDESTRIKNPQTQVTQVSRAGFRNVTHRAILTGLIAPESPLDVFCQYQFLYGSFMGYTNYYAFRSALFQPGGYAGREWYPTSESRRLINAEVHKRSYVLTRKQVGIGSKKIYSTRTVAMPKDVLAKYKRTLKTFAWDGIMAESTDGCQLGLPPESQGQLLETNYIIVLTLWLARIAGGFAPDGILQLHSAKTDELLSLLSGDLKGEKVVVWFRFNAELDAVCKTLHEKGFTTRIIKGEVPPIVRGQILEQFNSTAEGSPQILLAQLACAKYGVDASVADTAIYYSNAYSCETRLQSEDRIVHPKKTNPVLYIDLVTEKTVDEDIAELLQDKTVDARMFMTHMNSFREHLMAGRGT